MKDKILQILADLRKYALSKGYTVSLDYQEEDSSLMRFANSAISLNTNEHLIRLSITAFEGRKRAGFDLITDLEKVEGMKKAVDTAGEMVKHAQPLEYQPTIPEFKETFNDETGFDPTLAKYENHEKLEYFNKAVEGLESDDIKLSGVFSNGVTCLAQANTLSEHMQFFRWTDAQTTVVLSHQNLKWEIQAEQSAHKKSTLDPKPLKQNLVTLLDKYQHEAPKSLPLGRYDIVFGSAAIADMINFMNWIGFNGGSMKRGFSMIAEEQTDKQVFSGKISIVDDPSRPETFPFNRDLMGIARKRYPIFDKGVFKGFLWFQDDADEFSAQPTGHTVLHKSLALEGGAEDLPTLEALVAAKRENDLLYIPFLHYMNIVNPSKGLITASSRFGALYLKKDGGVEVPYNVRVTQSLLDIFGDKVAWLSRQTEAYNTSISYGARNPSAIIVPHFMCVRDLEISHSNTSY